MVVRQGFGADVTIQAIFAAECAPPKVRGALVMQWQMWTAFGIMLGYVADIAFYFVSQDLMPLPFWVHRSDKSKIGTRPRCRAGTELATHDVQRHVTRTRRLLPHPILPRESPLVSNQESTRRCIQGHLPAASPQAPGGSRPLLHARRSTS